jgi:AraC family transcriptional regulator
MQVLAVKNMVCARCILVVQQLMDREGILGVQVELGRVVLRDPLTPDSEVGIALELEKLGFELLRSKEAKRIESIKNLLVELVHSGDIPASFSLSAFLSQGVGEDYATLSHLFSSTEGITVEKYFIQLKIEKVKEWLSYGEFQVSEASYMLGYSSVQHLSAQFKKVTGMTPSSYRKLSVKPRKLLDRL